MGTWAIHAGAGPGFFPANWARKLLRNRQVPRSPAEVNVHPLLHVRETPMRRSLILAVAAVFGLVAGADAQAGCVAKKHFKGGCGATAACAAPAPAPVAAPCAAPAPAPVAACEPAPACAPKKKCNLFGGHKLFAGLCHKNKAVAACAPAAPVAAPCAAPAPSYTYEAPAAIATVTYAAPQAVAAPVATPQAVAAPVAAPAAPTKSVPVAPAPQAVTKG